MKYLEIRTQNKKGNSPQYKENLGCVSTFIRHPQDYIVVDDFDGYGKTYKQKELTEIRVYQNGTLIFEGNKYEFFEQLKK